MKPDQTQAMFAQKAQQFRRTKTVRKNNVTLLKKPGGDPTPTDLRQ
jgi:hypothetical protein